MVNGFRYYRALESVSIASALSTALTIYPCQIRVHQRSIIQTLRIREDTVVSSVFQLVVSMPSTTVSFLLLFAFGTNCRLMSLCPLPSRPSSLDWWASRQFRCQFRDIRPVFILHSSTFLSVCGTWIYRLLPALHKHLPRTTLLNSEECVLSEKKKKKKKKGGM